MRISDWSSDVCSSDLDEGDHGNDQDNQEQDEEGAERAGTAEFQGRGHGARQLGDDAGKNDQRGALADAALGDLLAADYSQIELRLAAHMADEIGRAHV